MLQTLVDFEVVGEAGTADEAIGRSHQLRPDLVLVDLRLPGVDGVSLTQSLKANPDSARVLLMTVDPSPTRLLAGLRAGADGGWLKGRGTRARLAVAVREARRGGPLLPPKSPRTSKRDGLAWTAHLLSH